MFSLNSLDFNRICAVPCRQLSRRNQTQITAVHKKCNTFICNVNIVEVFRAKYAHGLITGYSFTEWGCDRTAPPFHATGAAVIATAPAEPRTIRPEWCLGPAALIRWPLTGALPTVQRNGASPPLAAPAASITPTGRPSSTATLSGRHPAPPAMRVLEIIKRWRLKHSLRWANVYIYIYSTSHRVWSTQWI